MGGLMSGIEKSIVTNITDIINHSNSIILENIYAENSENFEGYQWIACLDSATCLVCASLDGKIFRSLYHMDLFPLVKTDSKNVIDSAPPGNPPIRPRCRCVMVPVLIGMADDPTQTQMTYKDWFDRQPAAVQLDIIGPSRFKEYLNGKAVTSFVKDGRVLTLKELGIDRKKQKAKIQNTSVASGLSDKLNKSNYKAGKNIVNEYAHNDLRGNFDLFLDISGRQGFDGLPTVVEPEELDKYIKENDTPLLWRGDNDNVTKDMKGQIEQFLNGHPPYVSEYGKSWYGRGIYSTDRKETARAYAISGGKMHHIYKFTLRKNAKILDLTKVDNMREFALKWSRTTIINSSNTMGNAAAAMGYDAIKVSINQNEFYYNILNRTAIITDGGNYFGQR